ncbi:glycerol-3-phosphate acyltransferase [Kallotenue papyrolyticum]|uniref:glycerol-3-phosphate acyltransferase n=1 Tax=Kallotenue papyrolyticum TaxID=1325125 RepID=UPI00047866E3|nr:glycerol-3-phosphate acyltransferase [Kallotenue papyrolyticum]
MLIERRALGMALLAYLLGALPGAWLVARLRGYDLRRLGDGNPGAHNVMRHVGRGWGLLALLIDAGKGALAVRLAQRRGTGWPAVVAGWLAVLGNNTSPALGGRGGKGLAVACGVTLALFPRLAGGLLATAALLIALTRNLALSALVCGLGLAALARRCGYPPSHGWAPLGLLALMGWKQWPDLRRMWREAPSKRALILERWIIDRQARL